MYYQEISFLKICSNNSFASQTAISCPLSFLFLYQNPKLLFVVVVVAVISHVLDHNSIFARGLGNVRASQVLIITFWARDREQLSG